MAYGLREWLGAVVVAAVVAGPALGADLTPVYKKAPTLDDWNPWQLRVRALGVLPDTSGTTVNVFGVPALSSPNSRLAIDNSIVPELDISYYFNRNFAAELILGVTPHDITGTGTLAGLNVGSAWLLPPTLTFQYHFTNFGAFQPYLGVGPNLTIFFDQSAGNAPNNGLRVTSLSLKDSFGVAAQAGFDYMLDRHWGINVDVKKIFLRPDYTATVNNAIPVSGKAHIDPLLVGGGVTYRF